MNKLLKWLTSLIVTKTTIIVYIPKEIKMKYLYKGKLYSPTEFYTIVNNLLTEKV